MGKTRLPGFLLGVTAIVLALSTACASAASGGTLLELKAEGKPLAVGGEVLLVAGYSLGPCYWEEQDFKVAVNRSKADKLVRTGEAGQLESCAGGTKAIEITSAKKMIVKLAPMRIDVEGPCVYEFKEISATFAQMEWGPEIYGTAAGELVDKAASARSPACVKRRTTTFDVGLSGIETALIG
ncbi:MAG TPA: hypothetical protein VMF09_16435 [Solirubrobacteraceae bacterium]|nr:hypothetical protein [Solirubrobacteraceae bacterium]